MSEVTSPIILNSTGQDIALALAGLATAIANKPDPATQTPVMDGAGDVGTSVKYAREDHQHPSDTTKANQAQLATVESGTTASRAYAVGEYFCLNGLLYRVTTAISSGGTFTPGTNCESTTVATEILSKGNTKYTQYYLTTAQTITYTFSKSCMFILMTERISTNALPQSDELSFGYISTTNKNTNRYHDLHAPTSDPVTISLELGYMTITTPLSNIRVTIIEFTDT